ncbi:MAG: STAS domain-containing protein [Dokdonella sp.]
MTNDTANSASTPDAQAASVGANLDTSLIRLSGEVDMAWTADVRRAILDAVASAEKIEAIGVELSQVSYIDSSGIAALVEGLQGAREKERRFVLIAVSGAVRAVLELARLDRVFTLIDGCDGLTIIAERSLSAPA